MTTRQPSADLTPDHPLSPLGKSTDYCDEYTPSLLFPIPRAAKRNEIGIDQTALPFIGEDLWNAYELSWLNGKGKPVVAIGSFRVPADSPCLIESKSFKLYLNSFNQTRFADIDTVASTLAQDLSAATGRHVGVALEALGQRPAAQISYPDGVLLDELDIDCDTYAPAPHLLRATDAPVTDETLYSHLLKSNCLVTGQPDWGMLVVRYRGRPIDRVGLLRYIVSFRKHNEFHEQCVERIFCDIQRQCAPECLSVHARYTRRGGLDINPFRCSTDVDSLDAPANDREVRQ